MEMFFKDVITTKIGEDSLEGEITTWKRRKK